MDIAPNDIRCTTFADYVLTTYITKDSRFPPTLWATDDYYMIRTTNACESYHSHLRNTYTAAHPNIFVYVTGRQQIQNDVYIIDFVLLVRTPYCSTKHDIEKRLFVQKYNNLYHAQSITRLEYLRHVSYKFLPVDL